MYTFNATFVPRPWSLLNSIYWNLIRYSETTKAFRISITRSHIIGYLPLKIYRSNYQVGVFQLFKTFLVWSISLRNAYADVFSIPFALLHAVSFLLHPSPSDLFIVKLRKPWGPDMLLAYYCFKGKKPIGCQETES